MNTNDELKDLMAYIPLTPVHVANFTQSPVESVKDWCSPKKSKRYNVMPLNKLKQLKFEIINSR
ncbi:hypothetical protein [Pseudoalteromonas denitrificans]|uniref:DNA-binding protein n=1 Tax=Pseudoalteromonas denitrificans DSM 6059 TaxID=1123010 RepID=A0A1I1NYD3_9GAMM|nr:hypothetical protein [Pseudoalteromonas denitrificans]SFD00498.1 hypothetical protein SAMN02745724_03165 [Pseudoalteromonas denitrificans DSM 6059]